MRRQGTPDVLFQYGAVLIYTHLNVRFRKRQQRVENAYPERDMKHYLYPLFLFDLKHVNKGKTPGMA